MSDSEMAEASSPVPASLIQLLKLSSGSSPYDDEVSQAIRKRRRARKDAELELMIDVSLQALGIEDPASVYPPESTAGCMSLLTSIYTHPLRPTPQTRLQRDGLAYYLLLDAGESNAPAASQWATQRWLSQGVREVIQGSWALDHDGWEAAVSHLANPAAQLIEAERSATILTLAHLAPKGSSSGSGKLLHHFCRFLRPTLHSAKLRSAYLGALLEDDFEAGWMWVKQGGFEEDLWAERESTRTSVEDDEDAGEVVQEEHRRLLLETMDYCLKPKPKQAPLEKLLTLVVDDHEQSLLTAYLLNPESKLSGTSFDILHDFLTLRLLSRGQHAMAVDLDKKVTDFLGRNPSLIVDQQSRRHRRQLVNDMISVLPKVERKLLLAQQDLEHTASAQDQSLSKQPLQQASGGDMGMSWETVERPGTPAGRDSPAPIKQPIPTHATPLSASQVIRSSQTPSMGIYQAILQSNAATPSRSSPVSQGRPSSASQRRLLGVSQSSGPGSPGPSSPFALPPRVPSFKPSPALNGGRNVSGSPFLRQIAASNMDRGQNLFSSTTKAAAAATPRRAKPIIGASFDEAESSAAASPEPLALRTRARKSLAAHAATPVRATPSRKARAPSTQPQSPPRRAKKPVQAASVMELMDEDAPLPGAFPTPGKRTLRSTAAAAPPAIRSAPSTDDEAGQSMSRKAKKASRNAAAPKRNVRQQSVASSLAEDDEDNQRKLRRSSRMASAAPTSPAQSTTSETRKSRSRPAKDVAATPRRTGVRTRTQAALMEE